MKRSLLALSLIALSFSANADNRKGWYVGGGATSMNSGLRFEGATDPGSMKFTTFEINGGYKLNTALGIEARIGTGLSGDERIISSDDTNFVLDAKVQHYESIYYRPDIANEIAKFYGLFGATNITLTGKDGSAESEQGFSWGAGVGFAIGLNGNINFEYRKLLANNDQDVNSFGLSYDYRF